METDVAPKNLPHYRLLPRIKAAIQSIEPQAEIILFGSVARGDADIQSDIDLLIIVPDENYTWQRKREFYYPISDIEQEAMISISPIIRTRSQWEKPPLKTPFIINVKNEGIQL
ncbi:nucleotidyltransferase domain-containing protein [Bacteroides sp. OttesenSCG-928-E20]|nr:nucleotidyltransferase domain-containing protein [Bacteroides sp. OttesenSCG-928-N06]MDL2299350.1 nucleotidyltransferase domain-containing protein [Bacteroides sp. OttesenSCG-928-E20]MDL2304688.1 nucleotidyltransferase domain-containing protein [Bacteroides sp. OttesenSCG-928-D19]